MHTKHIIYGNKGKEEKFFIYLSPSFFSNSIKIICFPNPIFSKTENTIALCVRKIKKKRRFAGYSLSSCRSSGNIRG